MLRRWWKKITEYAGIKDMQHTFDGSTNRRIQTSMITFKTNFGDIKIKLFKEEAPKTCASFEEYVTSGHFTNTIFHRVIPNFVIQGGGYEPGMQLKKTNAPVENEANNGLKNTKGTLSMARTADPHSATSQFFVNLVDNAFLDFQSETPSGWGYCVFGEVVDGMDIVEKIAGSETTNKMGHQDVPAEDIIVESAVIAEKA